MKKPSSVLVIGASRGIGHELARQYRDGGAVVHATVRKADDEAALQALGCTVHRLDVTSGDDWDAFAKALTAIDLDIALHNAGVAGPP